MSSRTLPAGLALVLFLVSGCPVFSPPPAPPTTGGGIPIVAFGSVTPALAKAGDEVTIGFTADRALVSCAASVNGQATTCGAPIGNACYCTYTVSALLPDGAASVTVIGSTIAGAGQATGALFVDRTPPSVDVSLIVIKRYGTAVESDGVIGLANCVLDKGTEYPERRVVSVRLWQTSNPNDVSSLDTVEVKPDGSFGEVPVVYGNEGAFDHPPPRIWVSAIDAVGNESERVEILQGSDADGPAVTAEKIFIHRRGLGQRDTVSGDPGALRSACALKQLFLYSSAEATAVPFNSYKGFAPNGSFPELPIEMVDGVSPRRVWVEVQDMS